MFTRFEVLRNGVLFLRKRAEVHAGLHACRFTLARVLSLIHRWGFPGPTVAEEEAWMARVLADPEFKDVNPDNLKLLLDFLREMMPLLLEMSPDS